MPRLALRSSRRQNGRADIRAKYSGLSLRTILLASAKRGIMMQCRVTEETCNRPGGCTHPVKCRGQQGNSRMRHSDPNHHVSWATRGAHVAFCNDGPGFELGHTLPAPLDWWQYVDRVQIQNRNPILNYCRAARTPKNIGSRCALSWFPMVTHDVCMSTCTLSHAHGLVITSMPQAAHRA